MIKKDNEKKLLCFLIKHFSENYSINQLAKQLGLTPKGMHKLLKCLENQGIVKPKKMANAIFYHINFDSDLARKSAELSLFEQIKSPFARVQAKDLERLRPTVLAAILFGSVLEKGQKAQDIDVMVVFEKKNYREFERRLNELQKLKTKQINPVMQTPEDLINNLKKKDKIMLEIIKTGKVLWGQQIIVDAINQVVKS